MKGRRGERGRTRRHLSPPSSGGKHCRGREGEKVAFLGLFDTRTPFAYQRIKELPSTFREKLIFHWGHLRRQKTNYLLNKLKTRFGINIQNQTPLENSPSDVRGKIRSKVRDAHKLAKTEYAILPYRGKINLFRALKQPRTNNLILDPLLGWGKIPEAGLDIYDVPGNHKSILLEPNVSVLASKVKSCLEKVLN